MCNKLFDTFFLPILLYSSEVWGAYDNIDLKKWDRDPIEKLHIQFYKYRIAHNAATQPGLKCVPSAKIQIQ